MVYIAKSKDGKEAVHHTDLKAMAEWDKVEASLIITDAEFAAHGNMARIINGQIFLGKTPKEKEDDAAQKEIAAIDAELKAIDVKHASRSIRASLIALKNAAPAQAKEEITRIEADEAKAVTLRSRRITLKESLNIPY